mmetsp:Transcript_39546/g.126781  ORF Transcript_39546/g.126781 Transcript_39546/m.126781 type:complete len:543 (-) Transcript_39546:343-1971(-)
MHSLILTLFVVLLRPVTSEHTVFGLHQEYGCLGRDSPLDMGKLVAACEDQEYSFPASERRRCCDVDHCAHQSQILVSIMNEYPGYNWMFALPRLLEYVQGVDVLQCAIGSLALDVLQCAADSKFPTTECSTWLGSNTSWVSIMHSGWPIFRLLAGLSYPGDVAFLSRNGIEKHLHAEVIRHLSFLEGLVDQRQPSRQELRRWSASTSRLLRRSELWWRRTRSRNLVASHWLWASIMELHAAMSSPTCYYIENFVAHTRHPEPYSYYICSKEPNVIYRTVRSHGHWPDADMVLGLFQAVLRNRSCTVVDVGANIGAVSLLLAKAGFSVIAIEPNRDLAERIRSSAAQADTTIEVVNAAATSEPGYFRFTVPAAGDPSSYLSSSGTSTLPALHDSADYVQGDRLDSLVRQAGAALAPVCALKIDSEGSDLEVLKGATEVLASIDVLVVEYNPGQLQARGVISPRVFFRPLREFFLYKVMAPRIGISMPDEVLVQPLEHACVIWESWDSFEECFRDAFHFDNILATRKPFTASDDIIPWIRLRMK